MNSIHVERQEDQIPLPTVHQQLQADTNDSTMFHLSQILITFLSSNTLHHEHALHSTSIERVMQLYLERVYIILQLFVCSIHSFHYFRVRPYLKGGPSSRHCHAHSVIYVWKYIIYTKAIIFFRYNFCYVYLK